MGLLDSIGGEMMGGRRGGERSMARGRENDRENRFDDRGRWSNNGRAMDGGRDFNNGGGRRGQFNNNNNGDMFNDRRETGAEGYERSRDGRWMILVISCRSLFEKCQFFNVVTAIDF